MTTITTKDGTRIFYKDWGPKDGQPIVFSHGWPLTADAWDAQMVFFANQGFRTIAHDRRSHGRSDQVWARHSSSTSVGLAGSPAATRLAATAGSRK